MASIIPQFLSNYISIGRVDLIDKLAEYTIDVISSNQDNQVLIECLRGLKSLVDDEAVTVRPVSTNVEAENSNEPIRPRPRPNQSEHLYLPRNDRLIEEHGLESGNFSIDHIVGDKLKYQLILEKIISQVCYSIFKSTNFDRNVKYDPKKCSSRNVDDSLVKFEVFNTACELCKICLRMCSKSQPNSVIYNACLDSLQRYVAEQRLPENVSETPDENIPIYSTLEVLNTLLDHVLNIKNKGLCMSQESDDWQDSLFLELQNVMEYSEGGVCGQVSTITIPKILKSYSEKSDKISIMWTKIKQILSSYNVSKCTENCFIVLCAFIDYFHPNTELMEKQDRLPNVLSERLLWTVIQNGFTDGDSLTRKRGLYLLKRVLELSKGMEIIGTDAEAEVPLFYWCPEKEGKLLKLWSDLILILETLEETQIHVVLPVLSRLSSIIESTVLPSSGWPLLHTSWLVVIFERLFQHETKTISRWGVMQVMSLDLHTCPVLNQGDSKFVLGPVLNALSDYTLYTNTSEKSQERFSDITEMVLDFFPLCVASLSTDQAKEFLQDLLSAIVKLQTKPVPLGFLCRSLSRVPSCKSWGDESLQCLRELLNFGIFTITPLHRGAIQSYLMDTALNLMEPSAISLCQLVRVLALFNQDQCMRRGTILWNKVVHWLHLNASQLVLDSKVQTLSDAVHLEIKDYMTTSHSDGTLTASSAKEATRVARMFVLFQDANFRANEQLLGGQSLLDFLQPLTKVLQTIGSHVYLPVAKADNALQLLLGVLNEADPIKSMENDLVSELEKPVFDCIEQIFLYLTRRLNYMDETQTLHEYSLQIYISVLDRLYKMEKPDNLLSTCFHKLVAQCAEVITRHQSVATQKEILHFIASSRVLAWRMGLELMTPTATKTSILHSIGSVDVFLTAMLNSVNFIDKLESPDRYSMINIFLGSKWKFILYLLQNHPVDVFASNNSEDILKTCLGDVSTIQGMEVMPALHCAKILVLQVTHNPSTCIEVFDVCWNVVRDFKNIPTVYWSSLEAFLQIAFQVDTMKCDSDVIIDKLHKIANDCFTVGQNKQGVVNILANQFSQSLLSLATVDAHICVSVALRFLDVLLNFYLFCPPLNKELRLLQDVSASIVEMGENCAVNQVLKRCNRDHRLVRVIAINLIVNLQTDHPSILQQLAPHMIQSLLHREKSESSKKYVCNSERHRLKEKIWQTILILLPCIQLETAQNIFPPILDCLVMDNQPSVKYFQEWIIIVLMHQFPKFQDNLWSLLKQATQAEDFNRNQVCSLITILSHVGTITADKQQKTSFYKKALPTMLSFCLSKNFSIQLYAQASLHKMWADCEASNLDDVLAMYPAVATCVQFQNTSSVHYSILDRLQANFFLLKFHPQHDCNFETIFYTIPYLTLMITEQLIPASMFVEADPVLWSRPDLPCSLKSSGDRQGLLELVPGAWKATKFKPGHQKDGDYDATNTDDVQKKIVPYGELIPGLDIDTFDQINHKRSKLILVTSLVNKIPNLGGLCRTSEIFGVGTVVLPNILLTETKEFQNLSVTAQKWLNLEEVRPYDLKDYLMKKKNEGYLIVGLEQTANSKCLTDCKFPPETLILLGNERTGIPVELINILDVCVEIPQLGVLRSLNVHVSGALAVWEYTKQYMMS